MKLLLRRVALRDTYTIGKLYIDGEYFCDTLENKVRDLNKNGVFDNGEKKIYGKTAIPYGTYEIKWTYSPKYKKYTPQIMNVPEFNGVRIHAGNTEKDTLGCILVGINSVKGMVLQSRVTVNKLYPLIRAARIRKEEVTLTIQ